MITVVSGTATFAKLVVKVAERARPDGHCPSGGSEALVGPRRDALAIYMRARMQQNKQGTGYMIGFGGALGFLLPGVPSWPLFAMGVAYLAPEGSSAVRMDNWLQRKFPVVRVEMISFMDRFLTDFERRFPESGHPKAHPPKKVDGGQH
jgi:hypothetical protein